MSAGRHIDGITLNPLEYILDKKGDVRVFRDAEAARCILKQEGFTDEEIYWLVLKKSVEGMEIKILKIFHYFVNGGVLFIIGECRLLLKGDKGNEWNDIRKIRSRQGIKPCGGVQPNGVCKDNPE